MKQYWYVGLNVNTKIFEILSVINPSGAELILLNTGKVYLNIKTQIAHVQVSKQFETESDAQNYLNNRALW